jgi:hypothetical protein
MLLGLALNPRQLAFSWLLAFMVWLSLGLGALFLVIVHHLFDAVWSVSIRRFCEHLACLLFPWLALLFLPVALLAPTLYEWMRLEPSAHDHALQAKWPLFTKPMWYAVTGAIFALWWWLSRALRRWSLAQDRTGDALCTRKLRVYAASGIFVFAVTLTLAAVLWIKGLSHQWFSTMFGVYYFAGSVWFTLATVYFLMIVFKRSGLLPALLLRDHQFYMVGSLMLAFTVFYAYIHFSQYFIIWNANVPEETYWYVAREKGTWFWVGQVLIFGHFFLPFLALLRIDAKLSFAWMAPLCVWAWLMHYADLSFNILPVASPDGFPWAWTWLDLACLAGMGGVLSLVFRRDFNRHPAFPLRDPRLGETVGHQHPCVSLLSGGDLDEGGGLDGSEDEAQAEGGAQ